MKKAISVILVAVILVSAFSVTILAASYDKFPDIKNKYYDKVFEHNCDVEPIAYREFHYYSDELSEEPDWALITYIIVSLPWEKKHGAFVGDRIIWSKAGSGINEFSSNGYAVYIPKTDTFISLVNDNVEAIIEQCPEFVETLEKYEIGQLIGDINEDNKIDVIDATYIQRKLAGYSVEFLTGVQTVVAGEPVDFSICDFDRDGETTVLDATAIQKKLAQVE